MEVTHTIADCRRARQGLGDVAFVPTMGALHAGHRSLVVEARRQAPRVVASLFVNPTQFDNTNDLAAYPVPREQDLAELESAGVDLVFAPTASAMYPPEGFKVVVDVPDLTDVLEGRHRPGHFRGVCLIVLKLLNVVRPQFACFGRKDFQQLRVIEALAGMLNVPTEIVACPTVRDADGLALSSRNARLSADERTRALAIPRALDGASELVKGGVNQTARLLAHVHGVLREMGTLGRVPLSIDYVATVDPTTLRHVDRIDAPVLLAVAARVGQTRLIDNALLHPDGRRE